MQCAYLRVYLLGKCYAENNRPKKQVKGTIGRAVGVLILSFQHSAVCQSGARTGSTAWLRHPYQLCSLGWRSHRRACPDG